MPTNIDFRKDLLTVGMNPDKKKYPVFQPDKFRKWPIARPKLILKKATVSGQKVKFEVTNAGRSICANAMLSVYAQTNSLSRLALQYIGAIMPGETRLAEINSAVLRTGVPLIALAEDLISDRIPGSSIGQSLFHSNVLNTVTNRSSNPANENLLSSTAANKWREYKYATAGISASTGIPVTSGEMKWKGRISTYPADANDPRPNNSSALYFFAGNSPARISEIRQQVTIADFQTANPVGNIASQQVREDLYVEFSADSASYKQTPRDQARMLIDVFNNHNDLVLSKFSDLAPGSEWQKNILGFLLHKDAFMIQVRLQSLRNTGDNNDGYFCNVSLVARHRQVVNFIL